MPKPSSRRRSPGSRWILARKIVQYLTLAVFLTLVIGSGRAAWAGTSAKTLLHLDPLTTLAEILAGRGLFIGAWLAMLTVGLTLVFGRSLCGWLCPLGTLLDLFSLRRLRGKRQPPPDSWRQAKYALLLLILFAALFTSLTLLVFDPLTLLVRTVSASLLPALDVVVTAVEFTLYRIPFMRSPVSTFDALIRPAVLPENPVFSHTAALFGFIFVGVVLLNLLAERFWCRYICPLGGMLGLLSKVGLVQREIKENCKGCDLCSPVCPTGTIQAEKDYRSDPSECTMCLNCLDACARNSTSFPARFRAPAWNEYDPSRRQALASLGLAAAGVGVLRAGITDRKDHPFWIMPPGCAEDEFLTKCIRCGECLGACPTGGLQPAISEAGIEGFWTPVLVPRLGYCHYGCNDCGQVCPVEAIPPLGLEEKQLTVIGQAYIDEDRCLPWADRVDCIVCEEMCPLPEKAIVLEEPDETEQEDDFYLPLRPRVIREECIGCGVCEYKCPLEGEAAIRVFTPT